MIEAENRFDSREELVAYVASIAPWLARDTVSDFRGGREFAEQRLAEMDPVAYCRTRNDLDGKVTRLSPFIRHGTLSLNRVRNSALAHAEGKKIEKLIQELAWRDYWQQIYKRHPDYVWNDVENYKTGYCADDYADALPEDIASGQTGVACIDRFIEVLHNTGYLHNHARMYVAAYTVHWRKVKWQAGARWFLHHLLDGDPASNNLSWQWVASTFSNKPYIFNLENVRKYADRALNTRAADNAVLDASYAQLEARLFPNRQVPG